MTDSQIKNLGFSIFAAVAVMLALLQNFSKIGLAGAAVSIASIFASSLIFSKGEGIFAKLDLYVLLSALAFASVGIEGLHGEFQLAAGARGLLGYAALPCCLAAGVFLALKSREQKSNHIAAIVRFAGLFAILEGVTFFLNGNTDGLAFNAVLFAVFGAYKFLVLQLGAPSAAKTWRCEWIAVFLSAAYTALYGLLADFRVLFTGVAGFLNDAVLPWYNVLGITLICFAISGFFIKHSGKEAAFADEDTLFLSGLAGFSWVLKSSLYFYSDFFWLAPCVFACFFFAYMNRFIYKGAVPPYLIPATALAVSLAAFLAGAGQAAFLLAVLVCGASVRFVHQNFGGWVRDAVFWQMLVLGIAVPGGVLALHGGCGEYELTVIAALLIFTSVAMWMMNYKNGIGDNKFKKTKTAMSMVFGLLVFAVTAKGGW
ncbi:MAG: hypothetical protein FWG53_09855 [Clostridiales bacterium]|nr:hypothetical protein [Clostridiales bacterium]